MILNKNEKQGECYDDGSYCPIGSLLRDLNLNTVSQEVATGLTILGAWVGCTLFASQLMDRYGRRRALLVCNLGFLVGASLCALAVSPFLLFLGRLVLGLAVGVEGTAVPALLSEIALPERRGLITAAHQFMITMGILSAGVVGYACVTQVPSGWRLALALTAVPALLQLVLGWCVRTKTKFGFLPESPAWLLAQRSRSSHEQAVQVIHQLRGSQSSVSREAEIQRIRKEACEAAEAESTSWEEVLANGQPVKIGVAIMSFQAACGINMVIFYSSEVFFQAGVDNSLLATVTVGIVNMAMTVVSMILVDRLGRKSLLVGGTWLMVASLLALSLSLFWLNSSLQGVLCVAFTLTYIVGFAIGFGGVGFVIICEIVPFKIRSKAMSLFLSCNWLLNLLLSLFSLSMIDFFASQFKGQSKQKNQKFGVATIFLLFALICLASLMFVYGYVTETKGQKKISKDHDKYSFLDQQELLIHDNNGGDEA